MNRKRHRISHKDRKAPPKIDSPFAASAARVDTRHDTLPPGQKARSPGEPVVRVTCTDYSADQFQIQHITDLEDFLSHHRPAWSRVRWINVEGFEQPEIIRALAEKYQLHPLAVDDVLHTVQRPKVEDYPGLGDQPGRLFVVVRAIAVNKGQLCTEQVSLFLGRTTLLTFQEIPGDVFEVIRPRIETSGSRLRENDVSFLFYLLIDVVVDSYFPLLEQLSERLDHLEDDVLSQPSESIYHRVHDAKRELLMLRRASWPMRDLISVLLREKHECLSETTRTYFRDIYDHCAQILDLIETHREITTAITETHMSATSNRLNAAMKVLTTISTIFIPLSFLAGVYGMNMPIPENEWPGMYRVFWAICITIASVMLIWLYRQKWL
jgi:magnesium transporter